jgi:hypothetical protein
VTGNDHRFMVAEGLVRSGDHVGMTGGLRARSFEAVAARYAASRPSFPAAFFDRIEELAVRGQGVLGDGHVVTS